MEGAENEDNRREIIGGRLKSIRESNGITQEDLANFLGVTQAYLSHIERGKREITVTFLLNLFSKYHWNPNWILLGIPPKEFSKGNYDIQSEKVFVVNESYLPYEKPLEKLSKSELAMKILDTGKLLDEMKSVYNQK